MSLTVWRAWAEAMRRHPDAAFVGKTRLPFTAFLDEAESLARRIPAKAFVSGAAFVTDHEPLDALLTTVAALTAGLMPILGSQPHHRQAHPAPALSRAALLGLPDTPYAFVSRFAPSRIAFATSGSTGEGEIIEKCWSQLAAEVSFLQQLTRLESGALVLSFVPPVHIYGFLYSFLLPIAVGADVHHGLETALVADADLVLVVPSLWPMLAQALRAGASPKLAISSGAPWDATREAEFLALKAERDLPLQLFDVLGSTETGGIGWRRVGVDSPHCFSLFDAVELDCAAMRLSSPYADPEAYWVGVADAFEPGPAPRSVVHRGRTDRIFKHGAKRYALAEIESALERVTGAKVRCRFREDAAAAKGGDLIAFVEAETLEYAALRRAYLDATSLPFPTRLFLVPSLGVNAMGKLAIEGLEAQATAVLP